MKTLVAISLACLLLLNGCYDSVIGRGEVQTREYAFGEFKSIEYSLPGKVIFEQNEQFVSVAANENLFDYFDFQVRNEVLYLELMPRIQIADYDDLTFHIAIPALRKFKLQGAGDFISEKPIKVSDKLSLIIDGSGNMKIDTIIVEEMNMEIDGSGDMDIAYVSVDNLECNIDGSGDIIIAGVAKDFEIDIDGSGNVRSRALITQDMDVDINGSGDTYIWVEDDLNVRINGSGSVFYAGKPNSVNTEVNGSGDVKKDKQ